MAGRTRRFAPRRGAAGQRTPAGRATTVLVTLLAGLLITVCAVAARGNDLRSDRSLSLRELIVEQGAQARAMQHEIDTVRAEVEHLAGKDRSLDGLQAALDDAAVEASVTAVSGPGVRVVLTDAPPDVHPAGVPDDALVVHQQDIQTVVNALWVGGAEAMTIQGVRVIGTTAIKCVGNTVVLHGVPYAPPYVIEAIGDQASLEASLESSPPLQIYRQYVEAYGLGYEQRRVDELALPGFTGSLGVSHARQP